MDRAHHPTLDSAGVERFLERQAVDHRAEHSHVISRGLIKLSDRRESCATNDVSPADHHRKFEPIAERGGDFAGDAGEFIGVDAKCPIGCETLAAQLEQHATVARTSSRRFDDHKVKDYNLLRMMAIDPAHAPTPAARADSARKGPMSWIWIGLVISIPLHGVLLAVLSSIHAGVGDSTGNSIESVEVSLIDGDRLEPEPPSVAGGDSQAPEIRSAGPETGGINMEHMGLPESTGNEQGESAVVTAGAAGLFAAGGGGDGVGGNGSGGATTFFGVGGRGKRIGYVIDKSGSMGTGGRMRLAKEEILRSVTALPDFASVCIALFDTEFETLDEEAGFIKCRRTEINQISQWIRGVMQGGGTDPVPAFQFLFSRRERPDVVFFMSDGEIHPSAADEILRMNRRGPNTVIHCIAFGYFAATAPLRRIAAETGGTFSVCGAGAAP